MQAEIIAIGDEITSGQTLDSNSQWLSQRLDELGIRVMFHSTVGDELEPCAAVFRQAIERADVVIATGGLGPTADDLTRAAVAAATGRELVLDEDALASIRRFFDSRGYPMPDRNECQAYFPTGSRVIANPNGTAPGIDLEVPRDGRPPSRFFAVPGVPAEMKEMWAETIHAAVLDAIARFGGSTRVIRRRLIHCFGAGESKVESMLPDLIRRGKTPTVGITASKATITLRIAAEGDSEAECDAAIEPTVATIRECLGRLVYGEGNDQLQDVVVRAMRDRGQTLSVVEWGTGGLVTEWLGAVPNVADVFRGGMVVTAATALVNSLGLETDRLVQPEHSDAVEAMAVACRERFGTDFALAVGKFPPAVAPEGNPDKACFALAGPEQVRVKPHPHVGHPALIQIFSAKRALNMVRLALMEDSCD